MTEEKKDKLKRDILDAVYRQNVINTRDKVSFGIGIADMVTAAFDVVVDFLDKEESK